MPNEPYVEEIMVADGDGDHPSTEEVKYEETQISDDVIGVKGNDETSYRNGYVNITQDNIVGNNDTANISDSDLIIFKKNNDSKWYRKAFSKIWDYIKGKIGIATSGNTFLRKDGTWATPPNSTYPYNIDKSIDADFASKFRTETKGNANNGSYIANIRTNDANVTGAPRYGSGLAWGMADTHGYLDVSYESNGDAWIGGGNANKLNWQSKIMTSNNIKAMMLDICYPVGSIYISTKNVSPATFLGGTWIQHNDYTLYATNSSTAVKFNTAAKDGGANSVTLTGAQSGLKGHGHGFTQPTVNGGATNTGGMSANNPHSHPQNYYTRYNMNYTKGTNNFGSSGGGEWDNSYNSLDTNSIRTQNQNIAHTHSQVAHTHSVSGGAVTNASASDASSSHSTIPNYKFVYMWERTA